MNKLLFDTKPQCSPSLIYKYKSRATEMNIYLNIPTAEEGNWCYKVNEEDDDIELVNDGYIVGPFAESTTIIVYGSANPTCFKVIYLPKPDCKNPNLEWSQGRTNKSQNTVSLKVVPNPFMSDQLTLQSERLIEEQIPYFILNTTGQIIQSGQFKGESQTIPFNNPSGVYFVKYFGIDGDEKHFKFVKL